MWAQNYKPSRNFHLLHRLQNPRHRLTNRLLHTGKINYKTLRGHEVIFDNQEWERTELKNEIAELKIELNKLKELVTVQNNSNNSSVQNMDELNQQNFLKLNIDEHVKKVINTSQKKSHDTLERISQTNTLISNLQLDFKKTRDLLSEVKEDTEDSQNILNGQKSVNTQQNKTIEESRSRIIDLERDVTSGFHKTLGNINSKQALELLVIGSSIVKFIDSARIEKRMPDATKTVCLAGAKISHILSEITSLSKTYNIKKMVIHVGGNHIPHGNPHAIITKLKDMIKEIISIIPETKLYYSLILSRISENYLNGINEINNAISTFVTK